MDEDGDEDEDEDENRRSPSQARSLIDKSTRSHPNHAGRRMK